MAISTKVTLVDKMTKVFQRQVTVVERMIRSMRQLDAVTESYGGAPQMTRTRKTVDETAQATERMTRETRESTKATGLLGQAWEKVKGYVLGASLAMAAQKIGATIMSGFQEGMKLDALQREFQARLGNADVGTAYYQKIAKQARESAFSLEELAQNTLSFFSMTTNPKHIDSLNRLAEQLAVFDKTGQGLAGAGFSLKEAMSGDIVSLAERFNMSKTAIRALGIDDLGKAGDIEGFIKAFQKLLETQNMGEEAYQKMLQSPKVQLNMFLSNLKTGFAEASQAGVQAFAPLFSQLNAWFDSDSGQQFFANLGVAMLVAGRGTQIFGALALGAVQVLNFAFALVGWAVQAVVADIQNVFTLLQILVPPALGILAGLATYWLIVNSSIVTATLSKLWSIAVDGVMAAKTGLVTAAQWAMQAATLAVAAAQGQLNLILLTNPIGLIVALIVGVIAAIVAWNAATGDLRQTFSDAFGWLVDAAQNAINFVINKINDLLRAYNGFGKGLYGIFGKEWKDIGEIKVQADFSNFKEAGQNFIKTFDPDAALKSFMPNVEQELDLESYLGQLDHINSIGEVGKIKDDVNISEEDIRLLRDVAEARFVQNFVTLHTGVTMSGTTITKEADVDKVMDHMNERLAADQEATAKGVYQP